MPSPFYLPFDYSYHYPDHSDGVLIPVSLGADRSSTRHSLLLILGPVSVSFPVRPAKFWDSTLSKV
jgi:hypothetical protein